MLYQRVQEWEQKKLMQGVMQGREEGQALLLKRQLTHRFGKLPEWANQRLENATQTDITQWSDRLFDANSLNDIFK